LYVSRMFVYKWSSTLFPLIKSNDIGHIQIFS
jgi:hypothetical protein